ncbi:MAG: TraR/DksA family transcriptional regulator [Methylococcales bacterium]
MASNPAAQQHSALKKQLQMNLQQLRQETRTELLAPDNEQFIELAGLVTDCEKESVADLLVDLNLALIDNPVRALGDTEAALLRFNQGTYGRYMGGADAISFERLAVFPVANRCLGCETRYEHTHAHAGQTRSQGGQASNISVARGSGLIQL